MGEVLNCAIQSPVLPFLIFSMKIQIGDDGEQTNECLLLLIVVYVSMRYLLFCFELRTRSSRSIRSSLIFSLQSNRRVVTLLAAT